MQNEKPCKPQNIRNKKGEVWKFVGDKHLLSNYGRWYSILRTRIMKQAPNNWGYMRVKINKKHVFTHIAVVKHFGDVNGKDLTNINSLNEHGLSIDHINRNKRNNAVSNLEIVSHIENCNRKFRPKETLNEQAQF